MAFKKKFQSSVPFVIGNATKSKELFPPGFCYKIGSIIYTVKADVTQEITSPMREVFLSDGATEIIPVESIIKDIKGSECVIMDPDPRFMVKKAKVEENKEKDK